MIQQSRHNKPTPTRMFWLNARRGALKALKRKKKHPETVLAMQIAVRDALIERYEIEANRSIFADGGAFITLHAIQAIETVIWKRQS